MNIMKILSSILLDSDDTIQREQWMMKLQIKNLMDGLPSTMKPYNSIVLGYHLEWPRVYVNIRVHKTLTLRLLLMMAMTCFI